MLVVFVYVEENKDADNIQVNADIADSSIHDNRICIPNPLMETENSNEIVDVIQQETTTTEPDIYQMDVWDLGLYLYDISYLDTSRALKLITYEGYGYSPLSYYVACCCWTRATENYWGYDNLFSAFGEADTSYDTWMDSLEIADWAYDALWECYLDPMYVRYCNGVIEPEDYIYCEFDGAFWIYVWN